MNSLTVYEGTPEQRETAQTLWKTATFPRGFLEGHQVKLTFTEGYTGGYTARGGHIIVDDRLTGGDLGFVLLHEIGHLGDYWCLTDKGQQQVLTAINAPLWDRMAEETWANGFATTYQPPGSGYPQYPLDNDLVRSLMDACGEGQVTPTFSDIPANHHYYEAIEWMAANGISIGYPDGTYRPDDTVTRGEMAVFLQRAADSR